MPRKPTPIDTNLLIRFFTNDQPSQAQAVEQLFKKAIKGELELPDVIIAEIVWVLLSFYKLPKAEVIEKLEGLLSLEQFTFDRPLLRKTIEIYRNYNVSYTDAYLAAYSIVKRDRQLYSFDSGFDRIPSLTRLKL